MLFWLPSPLERRLISAVFPFLPGQDKNSALQKGGCNLTKPRASATFIFRAFAGLVCHKCLMAQRRTKDQAAVRCEVCILAGGLSSRMGQDKARLVLGRRTLLGHIRATARRLGLPVRVIRRDLTPGCGPLGGIHTALKTSRADVVIFLSCDMPFVSEELLQQLVLTVQTKSNGTFVVEKGRVGFPFLLKVKTALRVERLLAQKQFALQNLAATLNTATIPPLHPEELFNINTPEDWIQAQAYS